MPRHIEFEFLGGGLARSDSLALALVEALPVALLALRRAIAERFAARALKECRGEHRHTTPMATVRRRSPQHIAHDFVV